MLILLPDAQYEDDALIERGVLGRGDELAVHRERRADRIPDERWRAADALIVYHEVPVDRYVVDRLDRCRIVVRAGVGYDQIDLATCGARGIPVCNVPDYGTTEVADHAIALLLGLARGLISYQERLLAHPNGWHWSGAPLVRRLRGACFAIVGLGRIGTATARRARALDMDVVFHDPYLPDGAELGIGLRRAPDLPSLLAQADVLSLHCPLTEETRHLLDAEAFAAVKPDALVINTARGGLIDVAALEAALRDARVGGAGLDVLPQEPPAPDEPLVTAFRRREPWLDGRLLLTPHAAWLSEAGRHDLRRKSARTVVDYLERQQLRNCVNSAWLAPA